MDGYICIPLFSVFPFVDQRNSILIVINYRNYSVCKYYFVVPIYCTAFVPRLLYLTTVSIQKQSVIQKQEILFLTIKADREKASRCIDKIRILG